MSEQPFLPGFDTFVTEKLDRWRTAIHLSEHLFSSFFQRCSHIEQSCTMMLVPVRLCVYINRSSLRTLQASVYW